MVRQQMLCVVTPQWTGQAQAVEDLRERLDAVFRSLGCVHFASVAVLPPHPADTARSEADRMPSLMLELAVDENLKTPLLIELLVARGLDELWPLYGAYAGAGLPDNREGRGAWLRGWLLRHTIGAHGGYVGARDRTVHQILREHDLYKAVRGYAAGLDQDLRKDNHGLAQELWVWANASREFDWAHTPATRSFWRRGGWRLVLAVFVGAFTVLIAGMVAAWLLQCACDAWPMTCLSGYTSWLVQALLALALLLALAVAALLLSPVVLALMSAWRRLSVWRGRRKLIRNRKRHARDTREVPRAHQVHPTVSRCEADLIGRPNHMISLTELRTPVAWHAAALRCWLELITWVGHRVFPHGVLGKASGIKFGHWHLIDGGRRLLFCSNFDGPFGGYLGEFIAGATVGVNLFWRRTHLLPRSAAAPGHPWHGGCEHEQWFKTYARDSMLPHLYLYQAYPHSQAEIERATRLRDALFGPRNAVNDDIVAKAVES
jgi:hypothetical protein